MFLLFRHADASVADAEKQGYFVAHGFTPLHPHANLALIGKLDGVAHKVDKHLPQPQRVAHEDEGNVRLHVNQQFDLAFGQFDNVEACQPLQHFVQLKVHILNIHAARFNL